MSELKEKVAKLLDDHAPEEVLQEIAESLTEKIEELERSKEDLEYDADAAQDLREKIKDLQEELSDVQIELDDTVDKLLPTPESPIGELSSAIFRDMAKSLSHDQIMELDAYAQEKFKNYIKLES